MLLVKFYKSRVILMIYFYGSKKFSFMNEFDK